MQALLDERDYQTIADKVLDLIKKDYDLVPKKPAKAIIVWKNFGLLLTVKRLNGLSYSSPLQC